MSHSTRLKIAGFPEEINIVHNGDWSGDARVIYREPGEGRLLGAERVVTLPGKLLVGLGLAVAKGFVRDSVISHLEQIRTDS